MCTPIQKYTNTSNLIFSALAAFFVPYGSGTFYFEAYPSAGVFSNVSTNWATITGNTYQFITQLPVQSLKCTGVYGNLAIFDYTNTPFSFTGPLTFNFFILSSPDGSGNCAIPTTPTFTWSTPAQSYSSTGAFSIYRQTEVSAVTFPSFHFPLDLVFSTGNSMGVLIQFTFDNSPPVFINSVTFQFELTLTVME